MRHTFNPIAALAVVTLLAACSTDDSPSESQASPTEATSTPPPDYLVPGPGHVTSPGRWGIPAFGDPEAPMLVVDVPQGFQGSESWIWTDLQGPDSFAQLSYFAPTNVPVDPCHPASVAPIGPDAADLVTALQAQERTVTSRPKVITLGGHDGVYVEVTTPDRYRAKACRRNGMQTLQTGVKGTSRTLDANAIDRYWVLDADGQRLVVAALTTTNPTPETVELITGLVEAVTFVEEG